MIRIIILLMGTLLGSSAYANCEHEICCAGGPDVGFVICCDFVYGACGFTWLQFQTDRAVNAGVQKTPAFCTLRMHMAKLR